ncbi:MAG: alpha/beta hydrolase [Oscillospiraceae bacterium]|nr:alpha/beta hydrolase [Oscillospiraceae bacterium]
MKRRLIPAFLALLPPAALEAVSEVCLRLIVKAEKLTPDQIRNAEREHGFSEAIQRYETEWNRKPFEINCRGAVLKGEIIDNPDDRGPRRKIAVICHGQTANRYAAVKYADLFYRHGFTPVIYDERYFGESGGQFCTLGQEEAKDLSEIIRLVRNRFGEDCAVAVHGESMGAATAILSLQYQKPDLVVADCPFADSELLFSQWIRRNLHLPPFLILPLVKAKARRRYRYDIQRTSPAAALLSSDVPVCLIHGKEDRLIPCSHSELLYDASRNPKSELHLIDRADHAQSIVVDPEGYKAILDAFLETCGLT